MDLEPLHHPLPFACLALHMAGYDIATLPDELPATDGEGAGFTLIFAADEGNELALAYGDSRYTVRVANTGTAGRATLAAVALRMNHLLDGERRFSSDPDGFAIVLSDSVAAAGLELHELAWLIRDMTEAMMLLGEEAAQSTAATSPGTPDSAPATSIIRG